ncbi:MAG: 50S ribosomal protein L10 [Chloroflexota bacterium]
MPTEKKIQRVEELAAVLSKSTIAIATDYRGLSNAEISQLRRRLREHDVEYHVVKNTLARLAAEQAKRPALAGLVTGPTALAFGYGDVVEPARVLMDYLRTSRTVLTVRGGLLDDRVLSAEDVTVLSFLPPREVIIAQLVGQLQGPLAALVNVLSANLRSMLGVLEARIRQLEGE